MSRYVDTIRLDRFLEGTQRNEEEYEGGYYSLGNTLSEHLLVEKQIHVTGRVHARILQRQPSHSHPAIKKIIVAELLFNSSSENLVGCRDWFLNLDNARTRLSYLGQQQMSLTLSLPAYHCRQWKSWRIYASPVVKGLILHSQGQSKCKLTPLPKLTLQNLD